MRTLLLILLTLIPMTLAPTLSRATIYLVAVDSDHRAVGMASLSSGTIVSSPATRGKSGVGFVGWAGSSAAPGLDAQVFDLMSHSADHDQIESLVYERIKNQYSRFVYASLKAQKIGLVFPPHGCGTPECGAEIDISNEFLMMGGGLESNVVPRAMSLYTAIHRRSSLPLECKLLSGLRAIVSVGGELAKLNAAVIAVDHGQTTGQTRYEIEDTTLSEAELLSTVDRQLEQAGIVCPSEERTRN